mmetsp:Transcript_20619/g.59736  ORF Transcript_20619/g.59736 Transcript_20619/m.59736 type:complete len:359 (-) Transcript_20619:85-1161(-)
MTVVAVGSEGAIGAEALGGDTGRGTAWFVAPVPTAGENVGASKRGCGEDVLALVALRSPPSPSKRCVARSWVWLSMASQMRLVSFPRSSISLWMSESKIPTVRCNDSTFSPRVSKCLPRSALSWANKSSKRWREAFSRCKVSWCELWVCSRSARSLEIVSCSSRIARSRLEPSRCQSSWCEERCLSRASFSRPMSSRVCSWCRSRAAFSWPSCSATRRSCASRAFFSPAMCCCTARSCASRARRSLSKWSATASWCCARSCRSPCKCSRRSFNSSATFCSKALRRCWMFPWWLCRSCACRSADSPRYVSMYVRRSSIDACCLSRASRSLPKESAMPLWCVSRAARSFVTWVCNWSTLA